MYCLDENVIIDKREPIENEWARVLYIIIYVLRNTYRINFDSDLQQVARLHLYLQEKKKKKKKKKNPTDRPNKQKKKKYCFDSGRR